MTIRTRFGVLTTLGQLVQFRMGFTPALGLVARQQLGRHLLGALNRTLGFAAAGLLSALIVYQQDRGARVRPRDGCRDRGVGAVMGILCPIIERSADRRSSRRLGVFDACLICVGFVPDSLEHVVTLSISLFASDL